MAQRWHRRATMRLRIDGDVRTPRHFDFAALCALQDQLVAPSGMLAGRTLVAVHLTTLLSLVGVARSARSFVIESADGSVLSALPIEAAKDCVVVYRVGDVPLPRGLGGPFRLMCPGNGDGDLKSLGGIYVSDQPFLHVADTARTSVDPG
jgi:DMSO/TMAO reductase YedYZ molybdopterin-dependent catalytic subunit